MSFSQLPSDIVNNILIPYLCKNSEKETINRWMNDIVEYCKDKDKNVLFKDLPEFVGGCDPIIERENDMLRSNAVVFYIIYVAANDIPFTIYTKLMRGVTKEDHVRLNLCRPMSDNDMTDFYVDDMCVRFKVKQKREEALKAENSNKKRKIDE